MAFSYDVCNNNVKTNGVINKSQDSEQSHYAIYGKNTSVVIILPSILCMSSST